MGISIPGLVPELQPTIDYLTPQIASGAGEKSLQLLREIASKLSPITSYLKQELETDSIETSLKFFQLLVGEFVIHFLCLVFFSRALFPNCCRKCSD